MSDAAPHPKRQPKGKTPRLHEPFLFYPALQSRCHDRPPQGHARRARLCTRAGQAAIVQLRGGLRRCEEVELGDEHAQRHAHKDAQGDERHFGIRVVHRDGDDALRASSGARVSCSVGEVARGVRPNIDSYNNFVFVLAATSENEWRCQVSNREAISRTQSPLRFGGPPSRRSTRPTA